MGEVTIKILDLPEVQKVLGDAQDLLFSANVEVENLRKQLDDVRAMLHAANEREQIQLKQAVAAVKARNEGQLAFELLQDLAESMWQSKTLLEAHQHFIAWRDRKRPAPMCQAPHPLEKIVDEQLDSEGSPT